MLWTQPDVRFTPVLCRWLAASLLSFAKVNDWNEMSGRKCVQILSIARCRSPASWARGETSSVTWCANGSIICFMSSTALVMSVARSRLCAITVPMRAATPNVMPAIETNVFSEIVRLRRLARK